MIPYLLFVATIFAIGYMNFVRPARRRRRAAMEIAPPEPRPNFAPNKPAGVTPPDGRVPRDLDRPYPRPAGGRRKLDKTCPVCGTGAETTPLDGKVLGWRAHGSCAEWLGDWKPTGRLPVPLPYSPDKSLIGYMEKGHDATYAAQPAVVQGGTTYTTYVGAGGTAVTIGAGGGGGTSEVVMDWLANGLISTDEARLRLNAEILSGFGLPGPAEREARTWARKACPDCGMEFDGTQSAIARSLEAHVESGQCERRCRKQAGGGGEYAAESSQPSGITGSMLAAGVKPPPPVIREWCTCGTRFVGTAEENRRALDAHHASGACPHSVKGRAADLRDLEGR